MNCINFPRKQSTYQTLEEKIEHHIQRVTKLQLLLDREEKRVLEFIKEEKQAPRLIY